MLPYFPEKVNNVTVTIGQNAELRCKVDNLNNYKVSSKMASERTSTVGVCSKTLIGPGGVKSGGSFALQGCVQKDCYTICNCTMLFLKIVPSIVGNIYPPILKSRSPKRINFKMQWTIFTAVGGSAVPRPSSQKTTKEETESFLRIS